MIISAMPIKSIDHVWQMPIHIIIVSPDSENVPSSAFNDAVRYTADSLEWWRRLSPIHITSSIVSVVSITRTDDFYDNPIGSTIDVAMPDSISIFMIDNAISHTAIYSSYIGIAWPNNNTPSTWVLMYPESPFYASSTLAHELGHLLFDLPDLYVDPNNCYEPDIMCYPIWAYESNMIGCISRSIIGYPCKRIFIPMMTTDGDHSAILGTSSNYSLPQQHQLAELVLSQSSQHLVAK